MAFWSFQQQIMKSCLSWILPHLFLGTGIWDVRGQCPCRTCRQVQVRSSLHSVAQQLSEVMVVWFFIVAEVSDIQEERGHFIWEERERVRSQCVYSEISALTNQESLNSVSTNKVSVFFKKPKNSIIPCEKHYFRLQFWCWAQGEINRGCLEVMWQLRQDELEQVAPDMHQPGSVSLHRGQSGRGYAPCLRAEVSYVVSVHTSCADQADICDTRRSAHTLHRRDALSVSYLQQAARTC